MWSHFRMSLFSLSLPAIITSPSSFSPTSFCSSSFLHILLLLLYFFFHSLVLLQRAHGYRQSDGAADVWDERQGRLLIGSRGGEEKEEREEKEEEVGGGKESVILTAAELFMMPQSQTSKSGRKTSQHLLSFFSFFTLPPSFPPSTFVLFPGEGGSPTSASLFKLVPLLTREEDRKWLQSFSPNPFLAASINKKLNHFQANWIQLQMEKFQSINLYSYCAKLHLKDVSERLHK